MERVDRPVVASFVVPSLAEGPTIPLPDGAAHHARVKRLEIGDGVRLLDGAGRVARATLTELTKRDVMVAAEPWTAVEAPPALHLFVPVADRDRMLMLAEKCVELGVTSWRPVYFARSRSVNPRGDGEAFQGKVRARMIAALEQSGGAWLPVMHSPIELVNAMSFVARSKVVFDGGGQPVLSLSVEAPAAAMIGPEGGFEGEERSSLQAAGWETARLEGNTLRFESAGIAAVAVLRAMLASP